MKYIVLLLLPLLIGMSTEVEAQATYEANKDLKVRKKKKMANRLRKNGSYYNAVNYYEDVHVAKPEKSRIIYYLGELNYELRDYEEAAKYFTQLMELDEAYTSLKTVDIFLSQITDPDYHMTEDMFGQQTFVEAVHRRDQGKGDSLEIRPQRESLIFQ